jgi:hypothetical protein
VVTTGRQRSHAPGQRAVADPSPALLPLSVPLRAPGGWCYLFNREIMRGATILGGLLVATTACSVGQGTGEVSGSLYAPDCWGELSAPDVAVPAPYNMQPDFFAANPYRASLTIEVQRGSDLSEFSDGLTVLVDDVCTVRAALGETCDAPGAPDTNVGSALSVVDGGATFAVAVPVGLYIPGSPTAVSASTAANPPIVHMSLYLESTCHDENVVLNAVSGTATFTALFDADPNEANAKDKKIDATFDAWFADLSDVPIGGTPDQVPIGLQSEMTGYFDFYFERGQPGQPFP